MLERIVQFGRCTLQDGYRGGRRVVVMMTSVGSDQLEAMAAGVPDSGYADPVPDICEIAAAQDGHRAMRRQVLQRLCRTVDEPGRVGIRDDLRQGAIEVEAYKRLSAPRTPISWP